MEKEKMKIIDTPEIVMLCATFLLVVLMVFGEWIF